MINQVSDSKSFELVVHVRDAQGNITDKTKSFATDDPAKLSQFYHRNVGVRKRKDKGALSNEKDAQKILNELYKEDKEDNTE